MEKIVVVVNCELKACGQNTKLLIWEESYYETSTFSNIHGTSGVENPELAFQDWSGCWVSGGVQNSQLLNQAGDSLHLLVNKMMMDNQFNLVGEGLIGRAAVTGNHQWILSKGFSRDAHPPEVLKELCHNFSAGIQNCSYLEFSLNGVLWESQSTELRFNNQQGQLTSNVIKTEVIPPNPDIWKQQFLQYIPKSHHSVRNLLLAHTLDSESITLTEQQISGENNLAKSNLTLPNGFGASQARSDHVMMSKFYENSVLLSTGVTDLCKEVDKYQKSIPHPNFFADASRLPKSSSKYNIGNGLQIGSCELKVPSKYVVNHVSNSHSSAEQGAEYLLDGSKKMGEKMNTECGTLFDSAYGECILKRSSIYGSTISSWVESAYDTKPSSSVSTGYSKKPDEMSKTSRKRLKPGENPRPRPKDRQMIQDRCSIDALFERTIKHMLFLQSVTKHADKLKQTGESKIISKEGGLLLKDNLKAE
ncbi:hypothetical protein HAX54_039097 [Datura stramonium]|uniref:Uncharacterized protein n=1 Tax=Datura stramonium TaxID=4076 RepID=A0ABS8SIL8_DATST|nr:hypothetical protein [Datura stramonium]